MLATEPHQQLDMTSMKKILASILFLAGCAISAYTQENPQQKWTLRRCIDHAVENNIVIKQLEIEERQAEINLNTTRNSRLPSLNATLTQGFYVGQTPVRKYNETDDVWYEVYENTQTANTIFSASTSIPVFSGMKITNRVKSDRFNLMAATENLNKARENLEIQVASYFLEVLYKKELLGTYNEQVTLTRELMERSKALLETGNITGYDLLEARSQLAIAESALVGAENELDQALMNLAHALNITGTADFDIEAPEWEEYDIGIQLADVNELFRHALDTKPHVAEADARLNKSRYDLKVAKADLYPSFSVSAGYGNYYYYDFNSETFNRDFRTQLKGQGSGNVGFNLSIPIFNRFTVRNNIRSANLTVRYNELELENVKLAIYKEINSAVNSARAARSQYHASQKAYETAQNAYDGAVERYEVGRYTIFEVNEARTKLLKTKSEQLQAKYDFIFRTKILDFYKGIPIDIIHT